MAFVVTFLNEEGSKMAWLPINAGFAGSYNVRDSCSGDHVLHAIPAPCCLSPPRPVWSPLHAKYCCARIQLAGPGDTTSNRASACLGAPCDSVQYTSRPLKARSALKVGVQSCTLFCQYSDADTWKYPLLFNSVISVRWMLHDRAHGTLQKVTQKELQRSWCPPQCSRQKM